jgi:hypothetical protein
MTALPALRSDVVRDSLINCCTPETDMTTKSSGATPPVSDSLTAAFDPPCLYVRRAS